MRRRYYVGLRNGVRELFTSDTTPTQSTHGDDGARYNAVIGPFKTRRGAEYMRLYGGSNPHCRTVADAERFGKKWGG